MRKLTASWEVTTLKEQRVYWNYITFCADYNIPRSEDGYEIYVELKRTHMTNETIVGIMLV